MYHITSLLLRRYSKAEHIPRSISTMTLIACLGIALSTFVLSLVIAIMQGFEHTTYEKLKGIHADISMHLPAECKDYQTLCDQLYHDFAEIHLISPSSTSQALARTKDGEQQAIIIRGIIPETECHLNEYIKNNTPITRACTKNHIVVGIKIAQALNLAVGDTVDILFAADYQNNRNKVILDKEAAYIGGFLKTGIEEVDSSLVLCAHDFFSTLFPDTYVDTLALRLNAHVDGEKLAQTLQKKYPRYSWYTWRTLYPAIFSALQLEKYVTILVIALISLITTTTLIALLFMIVSYKQYDIALLMLLGLPVNTLRMIFCFFGVLLTTISSGLGLSLSLACAYVVHTYKPFTLPDAYYVSYLPVHIELHVYAGIFVASILIGTLVSWLSVRTITRTNLLSLIRSS